MEFDDYRFLGPANPEPTAAQLNRATLFLHESGYSDTEILIEGGVLVAQMIAVATETLSVAPIEHRYSACLDTPDQRCVLLLAQRFEHATSIDLKLVDNQEQAKEIARTFETA